MPSISELRKKGKGLKAQLDKRAKESYATKDDSGKFGSIFNRQLSMDRMKMTEENVIDVLPWFAGSNYPTKQHNISPGDVVYVLDIWVHFSIGANEDTVVCLARNYGKPCPICEEFNQLKREGADDELLKDLKPKRRALYQVINRNSRSEEEKGIQLLDAPHFGTEKEFSERAKRPLGGGFVYFSDPDEGKSLYFKKTGQRQLTKYSAHEFLDRKETIPNELCDQTVSLDDYLIILSYEEIKTMHEGLNLTSPPPETPSEEKKTEEEPSPTPEEAPRRKSAPLQPKKEEEKKELNPCPGGGVYGIDIDTFDHCGECEAWDSCAEEARKMS